MDSADKELIERLKEMRLIAQDYDGFAFTFNSHDVVEFIGDFRTKALEIIDRLTAQIEALQSEKKRLHGNISSAFILLAQKWGSSEFVADQDEFTSQSEHDKYHKHHAMRELKEALGVDNLSTFEVLAKIEQDFIDDMEGEYEEVGEEQ